MRGGGGILRPGPQGPKNTEGGCSSLFTVGVGWGVGMRWAGLLSSSTSFFALTSLRKARRALNTCDELCCAQNGPKYFGCAVEWTMEQGSAKCRSWCSHTVRPLVSRTQLLDPNPKIGSAAAGPGLGGVHPRLRKGGCGHPRWGSVCPHAAVSGHSATRSQAVTPHTRSSAQTTNRMPHRDPATHQCGLRPGEAGGAQGPATGVGIDRRPKPQPKRRP